MEKTIWRTMVKAIGVAAPMAAMLLWTAVAWTQGAPPLINYQGKLETSVGVPVDSDTVPMRFELFNGETAVAPLWGETHPGVVVDRGIYSVIWGSVKALAPGLFDGATLFLQVKVRGETMAPRQRLVSAAWAIRAGKAGDAHTLDGLDSASFAPLLHQHDGADINVGTVNEANVDATIARDAELEAGLTLKTNKSDLTALENRVAALEALLSGVSRNGNELTLSGMNVNIVNGSGYTDAANGLGNLIVGYNEVRVGGNDRSGSHNLVVGPQHTYSSYGGLVAGFSNNVTAGFASVGGGTRNTASGAYASVSGGEYNTASNYNASVSGGSYNRASGWAAAVSGGYSNQARGSYAAVGGGSYNRAHGNYTTIGGGGGSWAGAGNVSYGLYSSILGGARNVVGDTTDGAIGQQATISGGGENLATGAYASISGGDFNRASGDFSFVGGGGGGGMSNFAVGNYSAILGGGANVAGDPAYTDHAIGVRSTIGGGWSNGARGLFSSVSGGALNLAGNNNSSVSGGYSNQATGPYASVSGGRNNQASGDNSSVAGGWDNRATGADAAVIGGRNNQASGGQSTAVGGGSWTFGYGNEAFANLSVVVGGMDNFTGDPLLVDRWLGVQSLVCGGYQNLAHGDMSAILGGQANDVTGTYATIAGGRSNSASGESSTVAGGALSAADHIFSVVSGYSNITAFNQQWMGGAYHTP